MCQPALQYPTTSAPICPGACPRGPAADHELLAALVLTSSPALDLAADAFAERRLRPQEFLLREDLVEVELGPVLREDLSRASAGRRSCLCLAVQPIGDQRHTSPARRLSTRPEDIRYCGSGASPIARLDLE